jgi:hypothetical protein
VDPAWLSLIVAVPVATLGGVWLWLRRRRQPTLQLRAVRRPLLPSAATADPNLLAKLRGASGEPVSCPACRREFGPEYRHCPYDASPLVTQDQLQEMPGGMFCPTCKRGFEPGVRACPHDGEELIPHSLFRATHPDAGELDDGMRKICPLCTNKYDGPASFCGRDGSELVLMN